ncbi:MAG: ABC transporter substrate-binding protein [Oscillospiraceae bacterium]|nr:ABC transporter substrate-binding protein [Oscillospiraceae bacterium]
MRNKRIIAVLMAFVLMAAMLAGCGGDTKADDGSQGSNNSAGSGDQNNNGGNNATASGRVYYLNFKPEQDAQWQQLAKTYQEKTGVPVTVLTAASGQYESTLRAEIAKREAPTLFQVNGPVGLASWKNYCYDMTGSKLSGELVSNDFALYNGSEIAGIAYVIETYGLIYNKALLTKAGYSEDDINNFADLKRVAEDITARSAELGFSAFASAGMDGSSDWRFKTHLANLPIYYEYKADGIGTTENIKGSYLDNYKMIWDLYINNAVTPPSLLGNKTMNDVIAEFVSEQAVFFQNGTWAYNDVSSLGDDNLGMLPIYIGAQGEEKQGLCTGTENYWCVNKSASAEDIQATMDFLYWCVTDADAVKVICEDMGFVIPFKKNMPPANPLVRIADKYVADGYTSVAWTFPTMPSEEWKNGVGSALTLYAAGAGSWNDVVKAFVDGWASEYKLING